MASYVYTAGSSANASANIQTDKVRIATTTAIHYAIGNSSVVATSSHAILPANTTGSYNVAVGFQAMTSNTTGYSNVAIGYSALGLNTVGIRNTIVGTAAGYNGGSYNNAFGYYALKNNTTNNNITNNTNIQYVINAPTSSSIWNGAVPTLTSPPSSPHRR